MPKLIIENWCGSRSWATRNSWNLAAFTHRLSLCTNLHGTELKRIARAVRSGELMEIEIIDEPKAEALIHTLESLGAKVLIR